MKSIKLILISLLGLFLANCNDNYNEEFTRELKGGELKGSEEQVLLSNDLFSKEDLSLEEIQFVAQMFAKNEFSSSTSTRAIQDREVDNIVPIISNGEQILAYAVNFKGGGYNIVSTTQKYTPIIGYNENGRIDSEYMQNNSAFMFWMDLLKEDIQYQKQKTDETDSILVNNRLMWKEYKNAAKTMQNSIKYSTTATTIRDHCYWYYEERKKIMNSTFTQLMSTDLDQYNYLVGLDYGNRGRITDDVRDHLIRTNNALKASYTGKATWAPPSYFWTEYFKDYNSYDSKELIKTLWDQDYPYNVLNPPKNNGEAGNMPAGCVTIAIAQILNYYRYPQVLKNMEGNQELAVDWNKTNVVSIQDTTNMEIPRLIRFVNQGIKTRNGNNSSSAYTKDAGYFLAANGYTAFISKNINYNTLIQEIKARRPVYVAGANSKNEGHAFICQGYRNLQQKITIELMSSSEFTYKDYPTNPYTLMYSASGSRSASGEYFCFNWGWGYTYSNDWLLYPTNLRGFNSNVELLIIKR